LSSSDFMMVCQALNAKVTSRASHPAYVKAESTVRRKRRLAMIGYSIAFIICLVMLIKSISDINSGSQSSGTVVLAALSAACMVALIPVSIFTVVGCYRPPDERQGPLVEVIESVCVSLSDRYEHRGVSFSVFSVPVPDTHISQYQDIRMCVVLDVLEIDPAVSFSPRVSEMDVGAMERHGSRGVFQSPSLSASTLRTTRYAQRSVGPSIPGGMGESEGSEAGEEGRQYEDSEHTSDIERQREREREREYSDDAPRYGERDSVIYGDQVDSELVTESDGFDSDL
ncbi:hypothetical protein KIPB_009190, partial [Kipferlia bialata]